MATTEAAGAAKSFFDALKGQPLSLALVVMNLCLLGFLYYDHKEAVAERKQEMQLLYQNRDNVAKLLFECVPPAKAGATSQLGG